MILLSSSLNSFIQLLGVLLIFLFVLVITYFTTKWIGGYQKVQMSGRSFQVVDTIRIANNKLVQVIKMGDVYLVIAVAKDNVTMLAKLTEEEMGLTEAEICNGKTPAAPPTRQKPSSMPPASLPGASRACGSSALASMRAHPATARSSASPRPALPTATTAARA